VANPTPYDPRRCAYGPAAHTAVCSIPVHMDFMRDTTGSCDRFLKRGAGIWLEHAQKKGPLFYARFEIVGHARAARASHLLQRLMEGEISQLWTDGPPSLHADNGDGAAEPASKRRLRNRAYVDVALSAVVPDAVWAAVPAHVLASVRVAV
jgi:hypothetical protein